MKKKILYLIAPILLFTACTTSFGVGSGIGIGRGVFDQREIAGFHNSSLIQHMDYIKPALSSSEASDQRAVF